MIKTKKVHKLYSVIKVIFMKYYIIRIYLKFCVIFSGVEWKEINKKKIKKSPKIQYLQAIKKIVKSGFEPLRDRGAGGGEPRPKWFDH